MKLFDHKKYEDFEQTLKTAYRNRDIPEQSVRQKQNIMRAIRHLEPLTMKFNPLIFIEHLAWRFTVVACLVVAILLGYMWYAEINPIESVAERLLEDPVTVVRVYEGF